MTQSLRSLLTAFRARHGSHGWAVGLAVCVLPSLGAAESAPDVTAQENTAVSAPVERVIELPPYVVEESLTPPWRYVSVPGIEVLSRCSDDLTRQLIDRQHLMHEELALFLPKPLQVQRAIPAVYVLYNDAMQPAVAQQIAARIKRYVSEADADELAAMDPAAAQAAQAQAEAKLNVRFMPNYRFWDADSLAIFFVLDEIGVQSTSITLTPGYLRYLLEARTPSLPTWFIEGMVELYGTVRLPAAPLTAPLGGFSSHSSAKPFSTRSSLGAVAFGGGSGEEGVVTFRPALWLSETETQVLRKNPKHVPALMPLATLFGSPRLGVDKEADLRLRRTEAALLIRWALDHTKRESKKGQPPDDLDRLEPRYLEPQALWEFVDRSCLEPVNEALFQECFGQTYAEAETRLRDYLPFAVKNSFQLHPPAPIQPLDFDLRDATVAEVSRLKGDLARLEIEFVKELYPQLTGNYIDQARRVMNRSLDQGDRDPRLLAVAGLCESDSRNDAGALPYLEAAVRARVPRSRVYYELARLKFEAIRPADPEARLSPAQVAGVLEILGAGRKLAQPLPESYELIAEVWLRCAGRLTRQQLGVLDEGIRYFPRRLRLIYSTALLYGFTGLNERAQELVELGLANSADEVEKSRFLKLWTAIHEDWSESGTVAQAPAAKPTVRLRSPKLKPEIVPRLPNEKEEPVVQLKEFKVSEVFPPINVRFNLSGENLFSSLDDPIVDARVTYVKSDGLGARMGIQVGDVLLALNGTGLKGQTIRQVAGLVEAARKQGDMIWEIRRGLTTLTLRHKGKWEIPLPVVGH